MLQALFYCQPFREKVLSYSAPLPPSSSREEGGVGGSSHTETLLSVLADLFQQIAQSKKKVGVLYPKKFITKVKKENGRLFVSCIVQEISGLSSDVDVVTVMCSNSSSL